jgi:hypothetical protein
MKTESVFKGELFVGISKRNFTQRLFQKSLRPYIFHEVKENIKIVLVEE